MVLTCRPSTPSPECRCLKRPLWSCSFVLMQSDVNSSQYAVQQPDREVNLRGAFCCEDSV
jgi:hypothetical protein